MATFDLKKFGAEAVARCAAGERVEIPDYNNNTTEVTDDIINADRATDRSKPVLDDLTEAIGGTPLVRLDKFAAAHNIKCTLLAKTELMSPGGSVKDRIARRMLEEAEKNGTIKKGDVVIEATSGNTGIGLALVCAVKGYRMVVVMPHKMSMEKENVLVALGALVIRTRTSAAFNDIDSHLSTAYMLRQVINEKSAETGVTAICVDQYLNPGNVNAHYYETAEEILRQTEGKISAFVATTGTGGTITGCAERLKKEVPGIKIWGVDPEGSILSEPRNTVDPASVAKAYEVEGIGYDFHPQVFHHGSVDHWVKSNDIDSFQLAREVVRLEGLLIGGSSGSALSGALKAAEGLSEKDTVVVLCPDSIRNYLSKFVNDHWMLAHGVFESAQEHRAYKPVPGEHQPLKGMMKTMKLACSMRIDDALKCLQLNRFDFGAVVSEEACTLMAVISREELAILCLDGKGDQRLVEVADPHSIYPFNNEGPMTPEVMGEARVALLSLAKVKATAVLTIIPKQFVASVEEAGTTLLARRAALCSASLAGLDLLVITKTTFLKAVKL